MCCPPRPGFGASEKAAVPRVKNHWWRPRLENQPGRSRARRPVEKPEMDGPRQGVGFKGGEGAHPPGFFFCLVFNRHSKR